MTLSSLARHNTAAALVEIARERGFGFEDVRMNSPSHEIITLAHLAVEDAINEFEFDHECPGYVDHDLYLAAFFLMQDALWAETERLRESDDARERAWERNERAWEEHRRAGTLARNQVV